MAARMDADTRGLRPAVPWEGSVGAGMAGIGLLILTDAGKLNFEYCLLTAFKVDAVRDTKGLPLGWYACANFYIIDEQLVTTAGRSGYDHADRRRALLGRARRT